MIAGHGRGRNAPLARCLLSGREARARAFGRAARRGWRPRSASFGLAASNSALGRPSAPVSRPLRAPRPLPSPHARRLPFRPKEKTRSRASLGPLSPARPKTAIRARVPSVAPRGADDRPPGPPSARPRKRPRLPDSGPRPMAVPKTRPSLVPRPKENQRPPSPQIKAKKNKSKSQSEEKKEGGADRGEEKKERTALLRGAYR